MNIAEEEIESLEEQILEETQKRIPDATGANIRDYVYSVVVKVEAE